MANRTVIAIGAIVLIGVALVGAGVIDLQRFDIGTGDSGAGMQTPPASVLTPTGAEFVGQLEPVINARNQLDNAQQRVEGTNQVTTWYSSPDERQWFTLGTGNDIITIDRTMNSIVYSGVQIPAGQLFYVSASGTADPNLNPRIIDFGFDDLTNDGIREFWFKWDLTDLPIPVAGQSSSTLPAKINTYTYDGALALTNPTGNVTGVGTGSGQNVFLRVKQTITETTASAQFKYELRIDNTDTGKWDTGLSTVNLPNLGAVNLDRFEETRTSSETIYEWKEGNLLSDANFVSVGQNSNTELDNTIKLVVNLATNDVLVITYLISEKTPSQGTNPVEIVLQIDEA